MGKKKNEIKEDEKLLFFIEEKEEFWSKEIFNDLKLVNEFDNMVNSFYAKINLGIIFYNVLGGN